ncbi:MAG: ribbon-helix-helix domain-containing protein, partial [Candidatus Bathyarchaeota archaeon]|nr:ribbon-helix-helix domain-containing protein [Candidatus Bathyarchaeota archaeon]
MGSKVIGFRLPEDMVQELERVCEERGLSVAEFLRSLVDETLYPTGELSGADKGEVTREEIETLTNAYKNLADDVEELKMLIDCVGTKISGYELDGILNPKTVESLGEVEKIKSTLTTLEFRVETLSTSARIDRDIAKDLATYKSATDRTISEVQQEIHNLQTQMNTVNTVPADITQLQSNVSRIQTMLTHTQRDMKRNPIGEIYTATYKDGTDHKFEMYNGKAGLLKPHRVV